MFCMELSKPSLLKPPTTSFLQDFAERVANAGGFLTWAGFLRVAAPDGSAGTILVGPRFAEWRGHRVELQSQDSKAEKASSLVSAGWHSSDTYSRQIEDKATWVTPLWFPGGWQTKGLGVFGAHVVTIRCHTNTDTIDRQLLRQLVALALDEHCPAEGVVSGDQGFYVTHMEQDWLIATKL